MPFSAIPDHLTTDRLDLTPEVPDDASWLATLFTSRGTGRVTTAEAAVRIRAMQQVVAEHGIGARVLRRHGDVTPLGYCAIVVGRGTLAEPELAYELLPEAQGHGYATEGSRVLLAAAFATGRERVWSTVRESNGASLRVLARLGFRRDRVAPDEQGAHEGALVWHVADAPARRR